MPPRITTCSDGFSVRQKSPALNRPKRFRWSLAVCSPPSGASVRQIVTKSIRLAEFAGSEKFIKCHPILDREITIASKGNISRPENLNHADHLALNGKYSSIADLWVSWGILLLLLFLCAVEGLQATVGLEAPLDVDSWRDVGFIQSFLNGNWFGDPAYAGEWRYYPPLMHGLGAFGVWYPALRR
jgi:hypothetical protein